uniref:Tetratricopeptide repeat protein 39B n=1 Tax=Eptatretus burgeri TaxID=7764 RepID=A0A8C4Q216_EPTBU
MHGQTQTQFLGGLHLGIGMFNLMLSMLPTRVLRLLEFIGFSGNKATGLARLAEGAQGGSLRAPLCALALLAFHCYICIVLGTGNSDLGEAEALLAPFLQRFPQGAVFVFFAGRIEILKGNVSQAMVRFEEGVACQATCPGFQHMSFWELMWCHAYQQQWLLAFHFANLLNEQSRWSKATYMYMKGAFLNMAGDKARSCPETEEEIFRKVPALRQKLAGKSLPTEKFVVAKVKRYLDDRPSSLILPALEMMYIWNGFDVLGRQPALAEAILETVESKLKSLPSSSSPGDICLVMFLKGACLRELGESTLATHCFQHVRSQDRRLRSESDSYLIPNALWELSLLAFAAGKRDEAILLLQEARNNYRGYALESRLQFRIHSALSQFNASTSSLS